MAGNASATIIGRETLPHSGTAYRFQGEQFGEIGVSFFIVDASPGGGPGLHAHPYAEVFVVHDGAVIFTVGDETIEAAAGQIVIVPAHTPHRYVNAGSGPARHIDIHASSRVEITWLAE